MEGENCSPWPFRIKLTMDHLRWDSLKISPFKEFEEQIISILEEDNRKALDAGMPIQVQMYDIDTNETYEVNLAKKQAFWFEPFPDIGQKPEKGKGEEFAYSLEPFKHIAKKRNLSCGMEMGFASLMSKPVRNLNSEFYMHPSCTRGVGRMDGTGKERKNPTQTKLKSEKKLSFAFGGGCNVMKGAKEGKTQ